MAPGNAARLEGENTVTLSGMMRLKAPMYFDLQPRLPFVEKMRFAGYPLRW